MLNFVICDDNPSILIRLSKMLESIFIKHSIDASVGLATDNLSVLFNYIKENTVDVLILDINLKSTVSGCDVAEMVRKKNKSVYIIFYTGHLEYALLAYKYKTFDYLCKPLSQERLEETVLRLLDDVKVSHSNFIKINTKTIINENDINYIKKDGMKLIIRTFNQDYIAYNSLNKFIPCLPHNFVRCHKSFIVNINNVTKFDIKNNSVLFSNNDCCSIGAKYKNNFLEVFNNGKFTNNLDIYSG